MLSDFQKRKFMVEFLLFDHDRDGVVERSDLQMMADAVASGYGRTEGSDEHTRVHAAFARIWDAFWAPGDTDGDGRVNILERFASNEVFGDISAEEAHAMADPVISGLFDALDDDSDGYITTEEYERFLRANGVSADLVDEAVSHVIAGGKLTRDEYVTLMVDYYLSQDPEAPANWVWGAR